MKQGKEEKILIYVIQELKKERLAQGLSHEKLAKMVGVTRPAISHIESGKCKPSFLLILKIALALEVPLGKLIKG